MMKTGIGKPSRRRGVGAVEEPPSAVNQALRKLVILDYLFVAAIFVAVGMGYPTKSLVNWVNWNPSPEFGINHSMCEILAVAVFPCSRMLAKAVELHLDTERDRTHWLWKKQLGLILVIVSILLAMVVTGLVIASLVVIGVGCAGSFRLTAAVVMGVLLALTMFLYLCSIVSNLLTTAWNGGDSTTRVSEVGAGAGDFDDGALLSGIGVPSECLFLKNMFDPKLESQPELLFGDMCGEVEKKLVTFGKIVNFYVDRDGSVYVRFEHIQSAIAAQQALHGEFNDGMRIAATFCGTEVYDVRYRRWLKRQQF